MNPATSENLQHSKRKSSKMTRASEFVKSLKNIFRWCEKKCELGKCVRITYGGRFGIFAVHELGAIDDHNLRICVFREENTNDTAVIIAPAEQCSFQFVSVAKQIEEKPFIGFTVQKKGSGAA